MVYRMWGRKRMLPPRDINRSSCSRDEKTVVRCGLLKVRVIKEVRRLVVMIFTEMLWLIGFQGRDRWDERGSGGRGRRGHRACMGGDVAGDKEKRGDEMRYSTLSEVSAKPG